MTSIHAHQLPDTGASVPAVARRATLGVLVCSRAVVVAATFLYGGSLWYAYVKYLYPAWGYFGMSYRPPSAAEACLMAALLLLGASQVPAKLARPSSIVLILLFVMVYVPTVVVTLLLDANRLYAYGAILVALGFAYTIACVAGRARDSTRAGERTPTRAFSWVVLLAWASLCGFLVYKYGSIMRFVGLSDIYTQRAEGASTNLLLGYAQTYFDKVLSPALIALGLIRSRWSLVAVGSAGCMIMFMINAQRTSFLIPFTMIALWLLLRTRSDVLRSTAFLLMILSALVVWSATYYLDSAVVSLIAFLLPFRTLALPGLTFSQYYDVFSREGFTFWSHVRGLDLYVAAPAGYFNDPLWPGLGYMVGDRLYGNIEYNANANLFSGDGAAAAGAIGVLVIGVVLASWLAWLDRASRGWNRDFVILVLVPTAMALTNAHLFTTLLSFGGLFWTLTFQLSKPRAGQL